MILFGESISNIIWFRGTDCRRNLISTEILNSTSESKIDIGIFSHPFFYKFCISYKTMDMDGLSITTKILYYLHALDVHIHTNFVWFSWSKMKDQTFLVAQGKSLEEKLLPASSIDLREMSDPIHSLTSSAYPIQQLTWMGWVWPQIFCTICIQWACTSTPILSDPAGRRWRIETLSCCTRESTWLKTFLLPP